MNSINQILAHTQQRKYPLPLEKWKYYQEWHQTLFFHWEVPAYFIESYIPAGVQLDTHNNNTWVSLVAFEVKNMRLRNLPSLPYISNFREINVRTYVIKDGIPGIYLFSIETDKLIQVILSRILINLPYQKSEIHYHGTKLSSKNESLKHFLDISMGEQKELEKTDLDVWLTERHALYEYCGRDLCRFDIHHKEWNLKGLEVEIKEIFYQAGKFIVSTYPDKVQYANKLEVLLWGKRIV
ncbi:YqjF family protein [Flavobacterium foetidum]|uniref:YqjF family protein n=1 Tax=Flavobacterium foetidum TaxID=2026681 RepID=UPI0013C2D50A|nr:DUF2071 domain-containing protein [Flavobacterium foetidum]KAF2517152.1 DUF2071 domain-containing protein [Flavobacterium foetidum]